MSVGQPVDGRVVDGGRLREQAGQDGHPRGDDTGVAELTDARDQRVGGPRQKEHGDHKHDHLGGLEVVSPLGFRVDLI